MNLETRLDCGQVVCDFIFGIFAGQSRNIHVE
jgi:hypothetical protein